MKCPLWNLTSFKTNLGGHFAFQKSHSKNLFITTSIRLEWPVLFLLNRTYLMDDWQNRTINFGFIDSKKNPMIIRPPNWSKVFFTYNLFEAKSSSDEISGMTIEVFLTFSFILWFLNFLQLWLQTILSGHNFPNSFYQGKKLIILLFVKADMFPYNLEAGGIGIMDRALVSRM